MLLLLCIGGATMQANEGWHVDRGHPKADAKDRASVRHNSTAEATTGVGVVVDIPLRIDGSPEAILRPVASYRRR